MTSTPRLHAQAMQAQLDRNAAEAKKLRAKARRLEAQGKHEEAGLLRQQVDGLRWENIDIRGW